MHPTTCPVNYPRTRLLCYPATTQTLYQLLTSSLFWHLHLFINYISKALLSIQGSTSSAHDSKSPWAELLLRAPSPSWLHASNKSVWCFCKLSLAAALPDPHFHRKTITIFGFCLAAHKFCLHSSQHHWGFCKACTLSRKIIVLYVPEESQMTFLHLWKFHQTLLPLLFPQTAHSLPQSWSISDNLQEKAEDHHFCTFAHCYGNFCTGVKGAVMVLGLNLELRQALCSFWKGNIWPCTRHQKYWEQWN